ncbi:apolipoprotein D and lipocalin family protein [Roseovarius lutimaris]|uniref:Apolipoprotein D and lipocalin family protein n=1 Tax=Roseovarius lutimaris TaxID=1005928 RepID=A0A1I5GM43_9RHOB|nr:lipocalin family protein [Roseovarius lutimaris]SFO36926.1 apolipoprotein D and lipocalin family protein [Roseovarius lutimaris]
MRIWWSLACVALISACAAPKAPTGLYRDTQTPLTYTTRSDANRLAGDWHVRAHYPGDEGLRRVSYLRARDGQEAFKLITRHCADNGACTDIAALWRAKALGPNRWRLADPQGGKTRDLWVIWVDEDYRTAAIGAPDGGYGWVLDRRATGGADRITAAREILDFNGYDIGAMILR